VWVRLETSHYCDPDEFLNCLSNWKLHIRSENKSISVSNSLMQFESDKFEFPFYQDMGRLVFLKQNFLI